jgi:hypothetical protein
MCKGEEKGGWEGWEGGGLSQKRIMRRMNGIGRKIRQCWCVVKASIRSVTRAAGIGYSVLLCAQQRPCRANE